MISCSAIVWKQKYIHHHTNSTGKDDKRLLNVLKTWSLSLNLAWIIMYNWFSLSSSDSSTCSAKMFQMSMQSDQIANWRVGTSPCGEGLGTFGSTLKKTKNKLDSTLSPIKKLHENSFITHPCWRRASTCSFLLDLMAWWRRLPLHSPSKFVSSTCLSQSLLLFLFKRAHIQYWFVFVRCIFIFICLYSNLILFTWYRTNLVIITISKEMHYFSPLWEKRSWG